MKKYSSRSGVLSREILGYEDLSSNTIKRSYWKIEKVVTKRKDNPKLLNFLQRGLILSSLIKLMALKIYWFFYFESLTDKMSVTNYSLLKCWIYERLITTWRNWPTNFDQPEFSLSISTIIMYYHKPNPTLFNTNFEQFETVVL